MPHWSMQRLRAREIASEISTVSEIVILSESDLVSVLGKKRRPHLDSYDGRGHDRGHDRGRDRASWVCFRNAFGAFQALQHAV
jgi:hypothetical protein